MHELMLPLSTQNRSSFQILQPFVSQQKIRGFALVTLILAAISFFTACSESVEDGKIDLILNIGDDLKEITGGVVTSWEVCIDIHYGGKFITCITASGETIEVMTPEHFRDTLYPYYKVSPGTRIENVEPRVYTYSVYRNTKIPCEKYYSTPTCITYENGSYYSTKKESYNGLATLAANAAKKTGSSITGSGEDGKNKTYTLTFGAASATLTEE